MEKVVQLINSALEKLGVNPADAKNAEQLQWDIATEKLHIMIDVFQITKDKIYFQLLSKLITINNNITIENLKFFLEENHTLVDMNISKFKDDIYLKSIINSKYLDENSIIDIILKFSDYGNNIISKFEKI